MYAFSKTPILAKRLLRISKVTTFQKLINKKVILHPVEKNSFTGLFLSARCHALLGYVIRVDIHPPEIFPTGIHYFHPACNLFPIPVLCFPHIQ
jgi:hypothetical protein